ncbi:SDR family oxidoreductase [Leeuwenhoekiella nanhaiensis]|uniref:Oxidoreductase n=1 Tax=Leeuwenhoekiella nanhaiensis TaxID=1655491 RepID=A0A2G1VMW0_9FLAO|nr:SDR family oxidoreductase [Leeuwenhoekiella nanhaiensis]PHQ28101.1 oxidoreductase [Leeuwenhoekiella nanhaiensis]
MNLSNKTVIVTGASSGIGEATAKKLAASGANVVITARRTERLEELKNAIEKDGGKALVVTADVTSKEDWKGVMDQTHQTFGKVDVLINNAGLMPLSFVENLKTDEWDKMVDVNIKGVLNGIASVVPDMKETKSGHIINISSVAGRKVMPAGAVYCATKYAVRALSEGIRQEMGPKYNTKVTAIEPGFVDTELTNTITDEDVQEMMSQFQDLTPLQAQDIANSIHYALTQPEHSSVNEILIRPTTQEL